MDAHTINLILTYSEARMILWALHDKSLRYFEEEDRLMKEGNSSRAAYVHILGMDHANLASKIEAMYP